MEIAQVVSNVGFPIALAIYLLQREAKSNERVIVALEAATQAIEASNATNQDVIKTLEDCKRLKWQRKDS